MKNLFIILILVSTVCWGQSEIVQKADSLFEKGQYTKAIKQFQLASATYRKLGNWAMVLTCQDAQRICLESMSDWNHALVMWKKVVSLNKDSLRERFEYNTIAYPKNSAFQITTESLEYYRKALAILKNWKGSNELQGKMNWYCSEGSSLMQKTFLKYFGYQLKSDNLLATEEDYYKDLGIWLKRLADKKLINAEPLVKNGQDSAILYYSKSLLQRDSSVWYLYRAAEAWIKTGNFNADSVYLSFVTHWMNAEPKECKYHQLLGWYYERQLNYDVALAHYSLCSYDDYYGCIVRKAIAFKSGLLVLRTNPRDTSKANQLVKQAMKKRKKKEYMASSGLWFEAAREYIKFNRWNRVYQCIYNADVDEFKDEMGGDVSKYLSLAQKIVPALFDEKSHEFGKANWQIGRVLLNRNENHHAFEHLSKAVSVFESTRSSSVKLSELYYEIGNASRNLMDYETAIRYHEKSLSAYQNVAGTDQSTILELHRILSDEYYETGEYAEAVHHLDWCWKSKVAQQNVKKWMPVLKYMEGKILLAQNKKDAAIKSFEEALKSLQEEKIKQALIGWEKLENQDITYDSKEWNAIERIIDEVSESVDLRLKVLNGIVPVLPKNNIENYLREISLLTHMPVFFNSISAYTKIESLNLLGSQIVERVSRTNPSSEWFARASTLPDTTLLDELETAWQNFSRAIVINSMNNYNPRDVQQETLENPPLGISENPEINSYQYGDLLLVSYLGRANVCFQNFMCGSDSTYLSDAQKYLMKCDSILDRARKFYTNESAKLKLAELGVKVYEMGTRVSMMLAVNNRYEWDEAFQFMEKGKSNILRQSLTEVKAKYFSGVPDSLFDQEKNIKNRLFELHRKLSESKGKEESKVTHLDSLKDQIFVLEQFLRDFNAALEEKYPKYFSLKNSDNSIENSRNLDGVLQPDEAIVEYLVGEENIFVAIYRDQKPFHFVAITSDTLLPRYIKRLRNSLILQVKDEFILSSNWLYEKIFKSVDQYFDKSSHIKKLIIIPDNLLGYIPFEVLMPKTQASEYADLPYLIKKYEIRYAYSAGMFLEQSRYQPQTEDNAFVAFAPVFNDSNKTNFLVKSCDRFYEDAHYESNQTRAFSRDGSYITPLPYTEGEVKKIAGSLEKKNLFAKFFVFQDAREEVLKSDDMIRYKYIHLATHGIINDHFPSASGLLLSQDSSSKEDGILYTGEIYSIKLNADMVVLSACETGLGKVVKGEGIIGLTRGWLYAGAKSLVVSLWKVADQSTSEFMVTFYNLLFSEKSKAEALQMAKLQMIKDPKYSEPFYWAPFILIGN